MKIIASPKWSRIAGFAGALLFALTLAVSPVEAAGEGPKAQSWSFSAPFGTFDRGQLQRGFKVYKEVCSGCHGLRLLHYRNLGEAGGPEFGEAEVKALAAEAEVQDGPNNEGEMFDRPGKPSDAFVSPFPNENAARDANNGAYPPDLSVMAKARAGGPDYIYALMTGYKEPPEKMKMSEGMSYNTVFPGHQIDTLPDDLLYQNPLGILVPLLRVHQQTINPIINPPSDLIRRLCDPLYTILPRLTHPN